MNLKKALPLIVALVLGLFAAKMAMNLMNNKTATGKVDTQKRPQAVVAKTNIAAGEALSDDNVQMAEVSSDTVSDTVFRSTSDVNGRIATVNVQAGQAITSALLAPKGAAAGLAAVIPEGFRAMTLEINEFSGVAGYISPGAHVDVILTMRNEQTGASMSRTIVQNVKVAATGARRNPQDPPDAGGRSVTVLVTPQQAEVLELASTNGRPRLTLRNNNDISPLNLPGISMADIRGTSDASKQDELAKIATEADAKADRAIALASQANQSSATPSTRPTWVEMWTVRVIRGGSEQDQQFPVREGGAEAGGESSNNSAIGGGN